MPTYLFPGINASFNFFLIKFEVSFMTVLFGFPPGLNEFYCSLLISGIPLLILTTQETQCVGKSGGINPDTKKVQSMKEQHHLNSSDGFTEGLTTFRSLFMYLGYLPIYFVAI
jgi:hypothetical protein